MKLVELLAKELKDWPEGARYYAQDYSGSVYPYTRKPSQMRSIDRFIWSSNWQLSGGGKVEGQVCSDYKTAIVTREMWQAERDKLKGETKVPKANKDGWIMHRGGKCPVSHDDLVEVRLRDGTEHIGEDAEIGGFWTWSQSGYSSDIMAYRLHKPEQASESITVLDAATACELLDNPGEPNEALKAILALDSTMPAAKYFDGPLQWRDRILEIDRTVEALEEERVSLIQRLDGEGFKLIGVQPVDMSDCLKCKRGDKVMANEDSAGVGGGFHKGGIYVMREDCTNKDHSIKVVADDNGVENGLGSKFFTFHSRPSA